MIIYEGGHGADYTTEKLMVATLKCDDKEEIKDDLAEMEIVGWPEGFGLAMDSTAVTMDLEVGKYDSEGHWKW
jgi:hypothetical protein